MGQVSASLLGPLPFLDLAARVRVRMICGIALMVNSSKMLAFVGFLSISMINSVTVLGSSSGRNAGDAALISGLMDTVDEACGESLLYEIPTIKPRFIRENYANRTQPIGMLPWNASIKMLGVPTYRSIMRTDLSLIFDAILFDRSLYNPLFNFMSTLSVMLPLARKRGKRMACFNVGAGPVDTAPGRRMLRDIGNGMDFITLRDQESLDIMRDVGVTNPRMYLAADSALVVQSSHDERVDEIMRDLGLEGETALLGINVNQYLDSWASPGRKPMSKERFVATYAEAIDQVAAEANAAVIFVATQYHDVEISRAVMDRLQGPRKKALLSNAEYSHYDVKGVLRRLDLLFAMRLHSAILCSSEETPIVGIAYQPKVAFFFNSLGLSEHCMTFDDFSVASVSEHLRRGWEQRDAIREQLKTVLPGLKERTHKAAELVAAMRQGEDMDAAFTRIVGDA